MATRSDQVPYRNRPPVGFIQSSSAAGRRRKLAEAMPDIDLGRSIIQDYKKAGYFGPNVMRIIKGGISESLSGPGVIIDFFAR